MTTPMINPVGEVPPGLTAVDEAGAEEVTGGVVDGAEEVGATEVVMGSVVVATAPAGAKTVNTLK